jgi:hypothetical protein
MDNLNRNLESLIAEFRDKGKAVRGLKNIKNFINTNRNKALANLLRFHSPNGVYGAELVQRFEIDALIEFYNLLMIAAFAGYIPGKLNEALKKEIIETLGHDSVRPYYEKYYEYKMTEFTLEYVKKNKPCIQEANVLTLRIFNEFVSLNRMLKKDRDLERFLGMLDYVSYGDDSIEEVIEILSSYKKLNKTFTTKNKSEAQSAVWGFVKYTAFLSQLRDLLQVSEKYPLLQSSLWMFHGYYFDRMNTEMKDFFEKAFHNLEKTLSSPDVFSNITEELYKGDAPETFDENELNNISKLAVKQAREDINYVLDNKWGEQLKNYFKN